VNYQDLGKFSESLTELDKIDRKLISLLQEDSTISNFDLSQEIGLSPSACLSRTKRLKKLGVIKGFTAIIDEKKVGLDVLTFTFVNLEHHNREAAGIFIKRIEEIPQILECHNITGNWDYLLKIVSTNISSYRDFIIDNLLTIPGVNKIETLIILKSDKQSFVLPTDTEPDHIKGEKSDE
jgi:Lrp/AsnC family leucine-responsive transcriptional regulator